MTTDQPQSNTIVLECDELPTEPVVLERLAAEVDAVPGATVNVRLRGQDVTSAVVVAGDGDRDGIELRLTDSLADS